MHSLSKWAVVRIKLATAASRVGCANHFATLPYKKEHNTSVTSFESFGLRCEITFPLEEKHCYNPNINMVKYK